MVSSSRSQLDTKNPIELPGEFHYQLRSTVRHDLLRKSVVFPNMLDEEARSACHCVSGECGCKMSPFVTESITTIIESWPADWGSSTVKFTLIVSQGMSGIGRG